MKTLRVLDFVFFCQMAKQPTTIASSFNWFYACATHFVFAIYFMGWKPPLFFVLWGGSPTSRSHMQFISFRLLGAGGSRRWSWTTKPSSWPWRFPSRTTCTTTSRRRPGPGSREPRKTSGDESVPALFKRKLWQGSFFFGGDHPGGGESK